MKKYLLLSFLVVAFFALSIGNANAVWKIGGTGPFLNYPFYVEGPMDGVTFKTFLVLNNADAIGPGQANVVGLIHYLTTDFDAIPGVNMRDMSCGGVADLVTGLCPYSPVNSTFGINTTQLTPTESLIIVPGTSNPGLGTEVSVWQNSNFRVGWLELWTYIPAVGPPINQRPDCLGQIRGEAITMDLVNRSAWSYKAVASVTDVNGVTSDMHSVTVAGADVSCSTLLAPAAPPEAPDVFWNTAWTGSHILPTGYSRLATSYNLDLWVKAPDGNPNNNTVIILTNPNHRQQGSSSNICRDCTFISFDLFNAQEDDRHPRFDLCEMRLISVLDDVDPGIVHDAVFYGWGVLSEFDTNINDTQSGGHCLVAAPGPQWTYPTQGPNLATCCAALTGIGGIGCNPTGPQLVCGLLNPLDITQGCRACDVSTALLNPTGSRGFLATAYTSWQAGAAGTPLTFWGNNLFNNCGDATNWQSFGGPISPVNACP